MQNKLHPKLRMVGNRSDAVNCSVAQQSNTVASTFSPADLPEPPPQVAAAMSKPGALGAPGNEMAFTQSVRQKKRDKLKAPGKQTFVNVFIEVQRSAAGEAEQVARSIKEELEAELEADAEAEGIPHKALNARNFVTATVSMGRLKSLQTDQRVSFVQPSDGLAFRLPRPSPTNGRLSKPTIRKVGKSGDHKSGEGVIIGIIDVGGFDFSHPDFSDGKGGTRFIAIWDQGGDFRGPPKNFDFGAEFTSQHLNAAMKAAAKGGLPATALEPQSQRQEGSHGTHVASIAAGLRGVCPKAEIAAVLITLPRLPSAVDERRTSFSDSNRIALAVEYLLDLAEKRNKPISINISLGTNGGSHDGASGISRWLDGALATKRRSICVAAGNAGQERPESETDLGYMMGRIHASGRIPAAGLTVDLEWVVVGNTMVDVSENELEFWFSAQDKITVQVRPPDGPDWIVVEPQQFIENRRLTSGTFLSIYNELYHPVNGCNYVAIYLSPDYRTDSPKGVQAGTWLVRLHGDDIRDGQFHCWIERDDPYEFDRVGERRVSRFPSFFSERSNVDSHSIGSLACGHRVIAVANLDHERQVVNITSSQGPTRDHRHKPDIAAPGTNIVAANGFGPPERPWTRMSGTSMASPYVAGVVGLMLATNESLTAAQCSGILQRTSRPLPGFDYSWRNDAGYGRIDPEAAVTEARNFDSRKKL